MKFLKRISFFMLLLGALLSQAQKKPYTRADSLKGMYSPERAWWNVLHYDLHVTFSLADSSLSGFNVITYKVLGAPREMQLDLMQPMMIDSVRSAGMLCSYRRDGNAYFISLKSPAQPDSLGKLSVYFHGRPRQAKLPPWDGGVVWARDKNKQPWISIACQGMAAQVWFPNKDHQADEPDSVTVHISAPPDLVTVSNGRLQGVNIKGPLATYTWKVTNPINNYNIIPYIGKYVSFRDTFNGKAGVLDLDYWVMSYDYEAAKKQFTQVKTMLRCFEDWFGPYPFYSDGYKLVQAPFLGMEHQGAIAYGNEYKNGYKGRDLSLTGWGLKWDFIIVHESGHEWFGNNITAADVADNWIHESFTAYSENLYTEYLFGKKAGAEYVRGTRISVLNDKPVISDYNVNSGGSIDIYYKGSNMLHTIRQIVNNDSLWKEMLRGLNRTFYHQTVNSAQIENYMSGFLKTDLRKVFGQYLRTTKIPVLEYSLKKNRLRYRWTNCVKDFDMQLGIYEGQRMSVISPREKWQTVRYADSTLKIVRDYYVELRQSHK